MTSTQGDPLEIRFLDKDGNPKTLPMKNWISQVDGLKSEDGIVSGTISLEESYVRFEDSDGRESLIPVEAVDLRYRIQSISREILIDGNEVVKYILKDFLTGEPDFFQR